jgi:hypothetical protein
MKKDTTAAKPLLDSYLGLLYLRVKSRWATWMHLQSQRLGKRGLMVAFGIFTATVGACCILLIFSGGFHLQSGPSVKPDRIVKIRAPDNNSLPAALPDTLLLKQIQAFKSYLQNLEASENGKRTRDSLLTARPGLMDSIRMAETQLYNQNKDHNEK